MQLATLETEFSPDRLSRKLKDDGFSARVSRTRSGRVMVVVRLSTIDDLASALTKFILTDWLADFVEGRIAEDHPYLSAEDQEYVRLLTCHAFRTKPVDAFDGRWEKWRSNIQDTIRSILMRTGTVNINGVLRFRARDFLRAVDYTITDVVEHFLADREYEEFVSMLRVMLDAQPLSTQTLHVFCTNERVWICDESGELLQDEEVTAAAKQVSDDDSVDAEDLAMSILIMRSPCAIVLHDLSRGATWPSFAETVERVFLERVSFCGACTTCARLSEQT